MRTKFRAPPCVPRGVVNINPFVRRETAERRAKEKSTLRKQDALNVSVDLFSRAAARQVFSALKSLTTVFGMGTGGPSS